MNRRDGMAAPDGVAMARCSKPVHLDEPAWQPGDGPGTPLLESIWIDPYPDTTLEDGYASPDARYEARESVELAFIVALQHLPARQRAVLILREVLGFSAREVAHSLDTTAASVNSALQRARKTLAEGLPERSQQRTLRTLGDDGLRRLVERYVAAWESRNVEEMLSVLVEDATFAMPPFACWFDGRDDIVAFLARWTPTLRHVLTRAGGQPAVAWYIRNASGAYLPSAIEVLTLEGNRVKEIVAFADAEGLFPRFGLPAVL